MEKEKEENTFEVGKPITFFKFTRPEWEETVCDVCLDPDYDGDEDNKGHGHNETVRVIKHESVEEEVKPERWRWLAFYGSAEDYLKQFDEETGIFHQFAEIDQSRLDYFAMVSAEDPRKQQIIHFPKGAKLIHYYRNTVLNVATPQEVRFKTYCFGYEQMIGGQKQKIVFMIYPNDTVHIETDDGRG